MATTVAAAFEELKQNLEITGLQTETVSTRQQEVRGAMENGFDVLDSYLSGSYSRSTMISPLGDADIDVFVVLDPKYYQQYTPGGLLNEVRRVLRLRYPRTPDINPDGQAVTIRFDDFNVDVVPGFFRKGGGYLIPDTTAGAWIPTDPKEHQRVVTAANSKHEGALVPLIKMMKGWNRAHGGYIRGFYLELMTMNVMNGLSIPDFPTGIRIALNKGREAIKFLIPDPAGYNDQVRGLRGIGVDAAVSLFERSFDLAREAQGFEQYGYGRTAHEKWRELFGDYFPAFG
jgi:hypothetical protein